MSFEQWKIQIPTGSISLNLIPVPVVKFCRFDAGVARHALGHVNVSAAYQVIRDAEGPEYNCLSRFQRLRPSAFAPYILPALRLWVAPDPRSTHGRPPAQEYRLRLKRP